MPRVNHLALFQFKPGCTADDIELVRRTIADLPQKISGIVAFNWSPDVSTEGLTDGFPPFRRGAAPAPNAVAGRGPGVSRPRASKLRIRARADGDV